MTVATSFCIKVMIRSLPQRCKATIKNNWRIFKVSSQSQVVLVAWRRWRDAEGVLGLDVPRCRAGRHGGPGQHHDVGTGACAWTCALRVWSLLVQTHAMGLGFQPPPPTPRSWQTKPQITQGSFIPPPHICAVLPLSSKVFSQAVKNLVLNTEAKRKG